MAAGVARSQACTLLTEGAGPSGRLGIRDLGLRLSRADWAFRVPETGPAQAPPVASEDHHTPVGRRAT